VLEHGLDFASSEYNSMAQFCENYKENLGSIKAGKFFSA
jgi:hypothetical protein